MYRNFQITLLTISLATASLGDPLYIQLSARDVEDGDSVWGAPDPWVQVSYGIGPNPFTVVGSTEDIASKNPDWPEIFYFEYVYHMEQYLLFEVFEADAWSDDDYGNFTIKMKEIFYAPGNCLERDFGKGRLIIKKVN